MGQSSGQVVTHNIGDSHRFVHVLKGFHVASYRANIENKVVVSL